MSVELSERPGWERPNCELPSVVRAAEGEVAKAPEASRPAYAGILGEYATEVTRCGGCLSNGQRVRGNFCVVREESQTGLKTLAYGGSSEGQ